MDTKLHLLETFTAQGSDGAIYKVHGYEHLAHNPVMIEAEEHWEPTGLAEYRLASGQRVEVRTDGSMRISSTGVQLQPH